MSAPALGRRTILARSARMLLSFVASPVGGKARLMFAVLVILLMSTNGFNVLISYVSRDFMTAIEQKDKAGFSYHALLMIGLFVVSTVAASFARYFEERLGLLWREWLTQKTLHQYMNHRSYQFIEASGSSQHPDQRISEDIRALTSTALSFMLMLLNSLLGIVAFAGVLLAISPLLLLVSFLYAVMGSLVTLWLGKPLIALNSSQVDREADFRSELLNVRTHAESIALLQRENTFQQRLLQRLAALVDNTRKMIAVNLRLAFFSGTYNYLIQIIPALLVAPLFIDGKAEFGIIAQSALAFTVLVNAFSLVVSQFPSISSFAAVVTRLNALTRAAEEAHSVRTHSLHVRQDIDEIRYENVTLFGSEEEPTELRDFTLTLPPGLRTLITAKNKMILLRLFNVSAGIENHSMGVLRRPPADQVLFIPEKPYLPPGTLREVLAPDLAWVGDPAILAVLEQLEMLNVLTIAGGLDTAHQDWNSLLSIGEQKLLEIARLLLAKPRFTYLLRLRSVLSDDHVARVMQALRASGITYINLGKQEYLDCYDRVVELYDDGTWELRETRGCDGPDAAR